MKIQRVLIVVVVIVVAVMVFTLSEPASSSPKSGIIVKLFSGGVQVGEWEASEPGRVEDGMYVFKVKQGSKTGEVRINGTFSIEAYD